MGETIVSLVPFIFLDLREEHCEIDTFINGVIPYEAKLEQMPAKFKSCQAMKPNRTKITKK